MSSAAAATSNDGILQSNHISGMIVIDVIIVGLRLADRSGFRDLLSGAGLGEEVQSGSIQEEPFLLLLFCLMYLENHLHIVG